MEQLTLVLDNIRSAYNVGSIVRSAAAFGVKEVYCAGITPHPKIEGDRRLPHVQARAEREISKTALGAQELIVFLHFDTTRQAIETAKMQCLHVFALEQGPGSEDLAAFRPVWPLALILGNEVSGIEKDILDSVDGLLEIKHTKAKESLNVASAAAIALFQLSKS